jgi:hypothetical protein
MSDLIFKTGGTEIEKTKQEIEVKMNWSEHTKIQRKEMQKQIEELQEQLQKLEEISPVEEAYKDAYGKYPVKVISEELTSEDNWNVISWSAFQNGYNASKVSETPQEPEELKTLYQMFYENDWNVRSCEVFCDIVKEWMSQYADNVMCGEYKKGYEYCLLVLKENLKND